MKTVYSRHEIPHLWMHQTQDHARTSSGNFYFSGPALYSYGSHFVCGFILPAERYGRAVLVNAGRYSMTTGRHMDATLRAIPGHYREIPVAGLSDNECRAINRSGTSDVRGLLLKRFRTHVAEAATRKNVRAATRAASLRAAAAVLADLRFLATCDKDRAALRKLPRDVPAIGDDASTKDARAIAEEFAKKAMREQFREKLAQQLEQIAGRIDSARRYAEDESARNRWESASYHAGGIAGTLATIAEAAQSAKLASLRAPAALRKAKTQCETLLATLRDLAAQEERAQTLERYADACAKVHDGMAGAVTYLRVMEKAAADLSALDSDAEKAQRIAEIERARNAVNASAPERALALLQLAGDAFRQDRIRDARSLAKRAEVHDAGRAPEVSELLQACDARERAQLAERIAAWRAGSGSADGLPHDREHGAMLRLRGDMIETSWGANVPVSVAPLVWNACNACREAGQPHEFAGDKAPRLGHFTLNRIDASGDIHVGCHFIRYSELQLIAAALKMI